MQSESNPHVSPRSQLPPHGGYARLAAFQKSEVIYQGTVLFCRRYLPAHGDRTVDQMVQAARSCKQNLAEGSATSATSKASELRLTGVARASLDELMEDFGDFLTSHGWQDWPAMHPRKIQLKDWCRARNRWSDYLDTMKKCDAESFCNLMICVIHQTRSLIDGMIRRQERELRENGDVRERLSNARRNLLGAKWDDGLYRWLAAAGDSSDLAKREREAHWKVQEIAIRLRRRNGWDQMSRKPALGGSSGVSQEL